jgi:hypothetical protein
MRMPTYCPGDGCYDKFPADPSLNMRRMVKHYADILAETLNPMAGPVYREAIIICYELKSELRKIQYLAQQTKKWPHPIDFQQLSKRILLMEAELTQIITDEGERSKLIVFQQLIKMVGAPTPDAGLKILAKATIPPGVVLKSIRPG